MPNTIAITVNTNQHLNSTGPLTVDHGTATRTPAPQHIQCSYTFMCSAIGAITSAAIGSFAWSKVAGEDNPAGRIVMIGVASALTFTAVVGGILAYRFHPVNRRPENGPNALSEAHRSPAIQIANADAELGLNPTSGNADEAEAQNNLASALTERQIGLPSDFVVVINPDQSTGLASRNNNDHQQLT